MFSPLFNSLRALALVAALVGIAPVAVAVEVLPPLLSMSDPNLGVVAGAIVEVSEEPPAIRFRVDETLRGDGSGELRLLVSRNDLANLSVGGDYLAVYSDIAQDSMKPRKLLRVAERARLMTFEGVELSLFRDMPAVRKLLVADPLKAASDPDYRQQIFAGLGDDDPQMADLWSGELALRAQRLSPFTAQEIAAVERFVRSPQQPERGRARLLLMAHDRQPVFGADWYITFAGELLAATTVKGQPDAAAQSLLYAALLIAAAHPQRIESSALSPWLASSPVLAEAAAMALRAQSPAQERQALDRTLARALLPAITRQFLEQHRQRLVAQSVSAASVTGERRDP